MRPGEQVETLLKPENKQKLVAILTYHVVAGNVKADIAATNGTIHVIDTGLMPK